MRVKNSIEIVETPIIDKNDFESNNGVINPAFLATPNSDDYRSNYFHPPYNDLLIGGANSAASSWVYQLNNGCAPPEAINFSAGTSMAADYGNSTLPLNGRYNGQHISYGIDLNEEHNEHQKRNECFGRHCCQSLLRLIIWLIIIVSVLGIAISVAFIIYIEKFAVDTCCDDKGTGSTQVLVINPNSSHSMQESYNKSIEYSVSSTPVVNEKTSFTLSTTSEPTEPTESTVIPLNTSSVKHILKTDSDSDKNISTIPVLTANNPKSVGNKWPQEMSVTELSTQTTHISDNSTINGFDSHFLSVNHTKAEPEVETELAVRTVSTTAKPDSIIDDKNISISEQTLHSSESSNATNGGLNTSDTIMESTTTAESINITATQLSANDSFTTSAANYIEAVDDDTSTLKTTMPSSATKSTANNLSYIESNYTTIADSNQTENPINHSLSRVLNDTTAAESIDSTGTNTTTNVIPSENVENLSTIINTTITTTTENSYKPTVNPTDI